MNDFMNTELRASTAIARPTRLIISLSKAAARAIACGKTVAVPSRATPDSLL
mgnify:CR=1 FL=1